ncbi:alpha-2-macroglobulin receptor-associated protein [Trichonephila clavipes]|nr:alpha-2-macroglobulin receptor-associated protein [Trichonephila clavipes]
MECICTRSRTEDLWCQQHMLLQAAPSILRGFYHLKELSHFEHRLKKLKTLTLLELEKDDSNIVDESAMKRKKKLKEYNYKVEKIQKELSGRILQRHSELETMDFVHLTVCASLAKTGYNFSSDKFAATAGLYWAARWEMARWPIPQRS